jgi:hypothetical protein
MLTGRWCTRHQRPETKCWALLVHRLHDGAYDPSKERTATSAANSVAEKAAQGPARSRIGTCRTAEEAAKECASRNTTGRAANDFGQLAHGHLLQDRADSLATENSSNDLNNNWNK